MLKLASFFQIPPSRSSNANFGFVFSNSHFHPSDWRRSVIHPLSSSRILNLALFFQIPARDPLTGFVFSAGTVANPSARIGFVFSAHPIRLDWLRFFKTPLPPLPSRQTGFEAYFPVSYDETSPRPPSSPRRRVNESY